MSDQPKCLFFKDGSDSTEYRDHHRKVVKIYADGGISIRHEYQRILVDDNGEFAGYDNEWHVDPEAGASLTAEEFKAVMEAMNQ